MTINDPQIFQRSHKALLVAGGSLAVLLGIIGILLPILPTTPFFLLAAYCYARSSRRCYDWLLHNRWFGEYIRNYCEGKGMTVISFTGGARPC